jgi:hypothetical protein
MELRQNRPAWLLLVHALPARPVNARVKTWRRLQALGAVALKNSIYVLPNTDACREDLEWMHAEIQALRGESTVFAADSLEAFSHDEIVAAFRKAREADYAALARDADGLVGRLSRGPVRGQQARRPGALRDRLERLEKITFFPPRNRPSAVSALTRLEAAMKVMNKLTKTARGARAAADRPLAASDFRRRTWVTRPRPGIDRMASAWLIRRFIDREARFAFAEKPPSDTRAVPFDMYGVEFGHAGTRCTFETLVARFGVKDAAVDWLGRLVHDVDLKDQHYNSAEAAGVEQLVTGLRAMHADDATLLEHGMQMIGALAASKSLSRTARRTRR